MAHLLTLNDVETRLKMVLEFFNNDTSGFVIHLSNYLDNQKVKYAWRKKPDEKVEQSNQEQKEKEKQTKAKVTTDMETKSSTLPSDGQDSMVEQITAAVAKGNFDLLALMKSLDCDIYGPTSSLEECQRVRRASALGTIAANMGSGSVVDKSASVVSSAIELAETEEKEDAQIDGEIEFEQEEFIAGDDVVIIEGDNCGLFGTLQHSTTGIFAGLDDSVKEDEDGYYGVDVHQFPGTEDACTEGFWIHPDALYHKKHEAGDEVYVTDGLNAGNTGNIQSDNGRLAFDDGCYGVDVAIPGGSVDGYWIHPASMKPSKETEQKKPKEIDEADLAEIDKFEFLPYVPYPGCAMDECMANMLNTQEIDINIKRLPSSSGKVVYRWGGQRHLVRFIHGVLLVKQNDTWIELNPILRKLGF